MKKIIFNALFKTSAAAELFVENIKATYNSTIIGKRVTVSTINSALNPSLTECDALKLGQIANKTRALETVQY